jgi:hypothetical protein
VIPQKGKADAAASPSSPCLEPPKTRTTPRPSLAGRAHQSRRIGHKYRVSGLPMAVPSSRGDNNHCPRTSVPSHKLPTPLQSAKSAKFEVTTTGETNDTLGPAPGSKRKRPTGSPPESNHPPEKRRRRLSDPEFPSPFFQGSTLQLFQETEAVDTAKVVPRTGGLDLSHQLYTDVESLVSSLAVIVAETRLT